MKYVADKKSWMIGKRARLTSEYKRKLAHGDEMRREELETYGHLIGKVVSCLTCTSGSHKDNNTTVDVLTLEFNHSNGKKLIWSFYANALEFIC